MPENRAHKDNICATLTAANRVFLTVHRVLRNVNAICFSRKNVVYLYSEEERAHTQRVLSSFLARNGGCFSFEVEISLVAREKFLVASGNFLSVVGARTLAFLAFFSAF